MKLWYNIQEQTISQMSDKRLRINYRRMRNDRVLHHLDGGNVLDHSTIRKALTDEFNRRGF